MPLENIFILLYDYVNCVKVRKRDLYTLQITKDYYTV